MAVLASDLLVVELANSIVRGALAFVSAVVANKQLGQHRLQGELAMGLAREVVHEPHHGLMAVCISNSLVVRRGIGPMTLHLGDARVHGAAAICRRVNLLQLIRDERQQSVEHIHELVHG
eukprot:CAMPEP_0203903916 /NCGR_PEP_ID=MMETSP0359-20131031/45789_1 /ASSEMBLY_ACC=CAM_ASM_000338 /TAXON_ID=268821 /ORGANISM="Scrippsiella Hangoei, Strain SHTV-5" /LENGTH=119 /DNA_ID=CAMNT_0050828043 /DNA_START=139 /DNA_END=498 /DNA_ORIENTATION=-